MLSLADLIASLQLQPHPEGGWYRETWRTASQPDERGAATAIYFLLDRGQSSRWHRVDAEEMWLWHAGQPITLHTWSSDAGPVSSITLGADVLGGQTPQHLIRAGHWQAAEATLGWALMSCIVAPAFRFEGFQLAAPGWTPGVRT
jgi:predicted cupin superfamily sugar epimerase